jgi:hypothetical protein
MGEDYFENSVLLKYIGQKIKNHKLLGFAILGFSFILALVFRNVIFHPCSQVLSGWECDLTRYFFPGEYFGSREILKGHIPLWDPFIYGGSPFFGKFQWAGLYPFTWLFLFLPMPLAFNLIFIIHEFLAGLFMYSWMASRKLHPLACFMSGTIFMLCGAIYLHIFPGHTVQVNTMIWLPLVFLSLDKVMETRKLKWVLFGIAVVSLQLLAGFPQCALYCQLIACIYVFFNLLNHPDWKKTLLMVLLVYLGTFGLTAIQLGAGIEASKECLRALKLPYDFVSNYSFPPECLLKTVFPDFFEKYGIFKYGRPEKFWETTPYMKLSRRQLN